MTEGEDDSTQEGALDDDTGILQEELEMRGRMRVDPTCLDEDMSKAASDIAYAGGRHARAILAHGLAKIAAKRMRGRTFMICKEEALDSFGKGATLDVIKALVEQDPEVLKADEAEVRTEARLCTAKVNVVATQARKDMLVQVGSTARAEMERDAYVVNRRGRDDR